MSSNKIEYDKLPSRVKYYLLEFKDDHLKAFQERFGTGSLRELSVEQYKELWKWAFDLDSSIFNQDPKGTWKFERNSGFAGYRCQMCRDWVYSHSKRECKCDLTRIVECKEFQEFQDMMDEAKRTDLKVFLNGLRISSGGDRKEYWIDLFKDRIKVVCTITDESLYIASARMHKTKT